MRAFIAGLVALCSIGCGDAASIDGASGPRVLAVQEDGGIDSGPDSGPEPKPCNWFVYWLTTLNQEEPCNWGMRSINPSVALFRTNGGECLAPAVACGLVLCADITHVREKQVIEVWGPAGFDADAVWSVTETFGCE